MDQQSKSLLINFEKKRKWSYLKLLKNIFFNKLNPMPPGMACTDMSCPL